MRYIFWFLKASLSPTETEYKLCRLINNDMELQILFASSHVSLNTVIIGLQFRGMKDVIIRKRSDAHLSFEFIFNHLDHVLQDRIKTTQRTMM